LLILQFIYVVQNEYQVLPYAVAVIQNDESRRNSITRIIQLVSLLA
jgi:hypothetical protein